MSLSLAQKKRVIDATSAAIAAARAAVLAEYRGLSVAQLTALRAQARSRGVWVKVVKNNLAKRAIQGSDFECLSERFVGPVIFSAAADAVAVAKVMADFAEDNESLRITAGVMDGELIDLPAIQALAKLPSRDELIARLMGAARAPLQKFATTLHEIPAKFARTVSAVAQAKEAA